MSALFLLDDCNPISEELLFTAESFALKFGFQKIFLVPQHALLDKEDKNIDCLSEIILRNHPSISYSGNKTQISEILARNNRGDTYFFSCYLESPEIIPGEFLCSVEKLVFLCSDSGKDIREGKDFHGASLAVLEEILQRKIYFASLLDSLLTLNRYEHVISVAKTAYELSLRNPSVDPLKAYQAGLFHDCGKDLEVKKQREVVFTLGHDVKEDYALHEYVSAFYANRLFHIQDKEVLDAIKAHCTGKKDMTVLDKIIYVADKIEPKRKFDTGNLYEECMNDISEGFLKVLRWQIDYFKRKGLEYSTNPDTKQMYEHYLGEY